MSSKDTINVNTRHANTVKVYERVMASYGELAPYMPKYKIFSEVGLEVGYDPMTVRAIVKKSQQHGSK